MINQHDIAQLTSDAWRLATEANRQANADAAIHASQLHSCPRALHYRYHRVPHSDPLQPELAIKAHIGTALHDFYLTYLARAFEARDDVESVEIEPVLAIPRSGSDEAALVARPDLAVHFTDGQIGIFEFKTTGKAGVDAVLAGEVKPAHLSQCRFAAALAEALSGAPVCGYWLYYLDRSDPQRHWAVVARTWNTHEQAEGQHLIDYAASVAADINAAPRWFGKDAVEAASPISPCQQCPWKTSCLGKDGADQVRAEAAAELVEACASAKADLDEAEAVLAEFLTHRGVIDRYRKGKEYLTDLIDHLGLEPGEYEIGGQTRRLVWREGHDRTDTAACVKMLEDLGKPVPKMRTSGFYQLKS
jgi:hypothetical protein